MTRQQAAAKARAARAAKRAQANGHITLELARSEALELYQALEASEAPAAREVRRRLVEAALQG